MAPPLPDGVTDVGLRVAPNLEMLSDLRPSIILAPPWMSQHRGMLERVGPTRIVSLRQPSLSPYDAAGAAARDLGRMLGAIDAAEALLRETDAAIADAARRIQPAPRALFVVSVVDPFHVAVYGSGSMFDDMLRRLGIANAWAGETNALGMAVVGADRLAEAPDAATAVIGPLPGGVRPDFVRRGVWAAMPFGAPDRHAILPPVWLYGGLPSARRFAECLAAARPTLAA